MNSEQTPHTRVIRLLLADDDSLVRTGISGIVGTAADIDVTVEAADGREAVALARQHTIDVALLDIRMPRVDGVQALKQLAREQPQLPVAMLTTFSDERYVAEAIGVGARGFFLKSDEPIHLLTGIRALAEGGAAFSPRVSRWMVRQEVVAGLQRKSRARELTEILTPRQFQLLGLVGSGQSNAQIAKALHLTEGTVKQYLKGVLAALGVDNRVQAAIIAHDAGITEAPVVLTPHMASDQSRVGSCSRSTASRRRRPGRRS